LFHSSFVIQSKDLVNPQLLTYSTAMLPLTLFYPLLGLMVGSFLNVCIHRIPRRESIVLPASHCPHCGTPIRPYDNVPLFSYLWLRGKCRSCKAGISVRYPVVEVLTALGFYACAAAWDFSPPTFVNSLFISIVIALVFIDYDHQILPDVITLPGIVAGILLSPFQSQSFFGDALSVRLVSALLPENPQMALPWAGSILGALLGGSFLYVPALLYEVVRKKQGLGMGDVKMMAMVGAFIGWRMAFLTIFAGSLLGSLVGVFLVLFRGRSFQSKLAFGTFLGGGAVLALFFGLPILRWYVDVQLAK
jgi:leader peptidase (prepilin peptidase)/N-methyltransferase